MSEPRRLNDQESQAHLQQLIDDCRLDIAQFWTGVLDGDPISELVIQPLIQLRQNVLDKATEFAKSPETVPAALDLLCTLPVLRYATCELLGDDFHGEE